jgi:hypothetical protein
MLRSGLLAFVLITVLALTAAFQRKRALRKDGWNYLTPGPRAWIGFYGGIILVGFWNWVMFIGPPGPPETAEETRLVFYVAFGAHLLLIYLTYWIAVEEVRWNATVLEKRDLLFRRHILYWPMLAGFGRVPLSEEYWVSSYDGERIRFRGRAGGAAELIAKIQNELTDDIPPGEPALT